MKIKGKIVISFISIFVITIVILCIIVVCADIREAQYGYELSSRIMEKDCRTRYPIVVAPHWGPPRFEKKDEQGKSIKYYYRPVIDILRNLGADIRVAQYANDYDTTPQRAQELKQFIISNFVDNTGYAAIWRRENPGNRFKVNIIAHSQGCQDSRYMISNLEMSGMTASWTGLAGESRGTPIADLLIALYDNTSHNIFMRSLWINYFVRNFPDIESEKRYIESVRCLCEDYMQNRGIYGVGGRLEGMGYSAPYVSSIYYQDWAAKVKWIPRDWSKNYLYWKYILITRGDNDIYTPISSQVHDRNFVVLRGVLEGDQWCAGVHHMAFTGSLNQQNPGFLQDQFWIDMVAELREMGY